MATSSCRLLPLLLLWALPSAVEAQFTFTTNNGTITITRYTGYDGDVAIPNTINGLLVASIGDSAFYNCPSVISVAIPNGVTNIGANVFSYCTLLTAITVDIDNPAYSSVGGVLFNKGRTTLINYPWGKAGAYTILSSVLHIGSGAFLGCSGLTSVVIPNHVIDIGDGAFQYCSSLTGVTIPDSVTSIGNAAFDTCGLTSATIGNKVTSIGGYAFSKCSSLQSVTIGTNVTGIGR
jgi:hypothetical protein